MNSFRRVGLTRWIMVLSVLVASCGPSDVEIQERIDKAVDQRLATTTVPAPGSTRQTTSAEASTTTADTVGPIVLEVYDLLRIWELTVAGGLPRGELNAQWPVVSAEVERALEAGPFDDRLLALETAADAWQLCHTANNDVLTPTSDHRTFDGRILLLRRQIADLLYEDVACADAFLAMDSARAVLGEDLQYEQIAVPTVSDNIDRTSPVLLRPFGVSLGENGELPFGYSAERTIRMLSVWLGIPDFDSGWNQLGESVVCHRPFEAGSATITHNRVVEWPGMTVHFVRDPGVPLETTDVDHFSGYVAWYVAGIADPSDPGYQGVLLETPEGISIASSLEEVRSAYSVEAGTGRVSVFESRSVFGINDVFPFEDQILYWGLLGPFLDQVETIESGEVCSSVAGV